MKRILVTGSGGSPSTNFVRSLRMMKEKVFIVGMDADKYYVQRSETDITYLGPSYKEKHYFDYLNYIIKKHKLEFMHIQNDLELEAVSKNREKLHIKTFLPSKKTVEICINKYESAKIWEQAGIKVPKNYFINTYKDLQDAFKKLKGKLWLREISGAAGKGSLAPSSLEQAKIWIDFKEGWGKFTAAELLTPNSITWMSIWKDGKLVVAQGRKRLYWELGRLSPSGVTGITGAGVTVTDRFLDTLAQKSVLSIDPTPHGIYSVDLTYDFKGIPNPTEINIGRFFTTHEFFSRAGLNMPEIYLKLAYDEKIPIFKKKLNPLKNGLVWIRGMDFLPVLVHEKEIEKSVTTMKKIMKAIS